MKSEKSIPILNKISIIILTKNEIEGVTAMMPKVPRSWYPRCVVVDYHSTDGTVEYFKKQNIRVITQKTPGRGNAFRLGVENASGEYLIFFSPDGNENPADIPKFIDSLDSGADLVIGSRFIKGSRNEEDDQLIKPRAWANRLFTFIVRILWGGHVTDTINGYRAIRKSVYKKLRLDAPSFAIEFQMSIRALKSHMKIAEIPTIESNRIGGQSTSYAIPTGLNFLYFLAREIRIGNSFEKEI